MRKVVAIALIGCLNIVSAQEISSIDITSDYSKVIEQVIEKPSAKPMWQESQLQLQQQLQMPVNNWQDSKKPEAQYKGYLITIFF